VKDFGGIKIVFSAAFGVIVLGAGASQKCYKKTLEWLALPDTDSPVPNI
jgi:hypothetical protein